MNHSKPTVTIFADASAIPKTQTAGWGGWARGDGRSGVFFSGQAKWSPSIDVVELEALARTVHKVMGDGTVKPYILPEDKHIMLQSDSLSALQVLRNLPNSWATDHKQGAKIGRAIEVNPAKPHYKWFCVIQELTRDMEVVYLRHVRGHQGEHTSGRHWVNERVDKLAGEAARRQGELKL